MSNLSESACMHVGECEKYTNYQNYLSMVWGVMIFKFQPNLAHHL